MKSKTSVDALYYDGDVDTNSSGNPHLNDLIVTRYSRRQTLFGGLHAAGAAVFGGLLLAGCGEDDSASAVTVDAGGAISTTSGRTVTLTGSVSGGSTGSIAWSQVSGPPVALTPTGDGVTVRFTALSVAASTPLGFRFTGTGTGGAGSTADTTVTVGPAQLGFAAVSKSLADVVSVPAGYGVTVLYRTAIRSRRAFPPMPTTAPTAISRSARAIITTA